MCKKTQSTRIVLYYINFGFVASLYGWHKSAILSIFLFDAPGSTRELMPNILAISIWLYPAVVIASVVMFWQSRNDDNILNPIRITTTGLLILSVMLIIMHTGGVLWL